MISKFRLKTAEAVTKSSPIVGIKDNVLWLETSVTESLNPTETDNGDSISTWNSISAAPNKIAVEAVGAGPSYSNSINHIHAVKFDAASVTKPSASNHLQIPNASFLNNTDYTIVVLEKRQSSGVNNYFIGDSSNTTANQSLLLGYSLDGKVVHSQGSGASYEANVSAYADSKDKARIFTFVQSSNCGKKTYINGLLAAEDSSTQKLSGISNLLIGKGYTGEIGEIAIFNKALLNEERKSVEDYLGKKWIAKINRDLVAGGSCTSGTVTDSGCSMDCSTSSIAGVTSPTAVTDGQSGVTATCGATGYAGTITVACTAGTGSITKSGDCGCDSGAGYSLVGGVCVGQCSVSVSGSSVSSVSHGDTQVACDAGGGYASTPFTFAACSGASISGSCSCNTGYADSTCSICDTANDYQSVGGLCKKSCTITGQVGIVNNTKVLHGSTSASCGSGYLGNFNYTCNEGTLGSISNNCKLACTGGARTVSANNKIIHTFTSGTDNFNCPEAKTVNLLVVGGGVGGGGGGAGGLIYQANYSISASTDYPVAVGSSVAFTTQGNPSSFGSLTALGGGRGVNYSASGGGSGSGAANTSATLNGGLGTAGQGSNGGKAYLSSGSNNVTSFSGGGGGACGVGKNAVAGFGGDGGDGCPIDIDGDGTSVYYAGGGGGGNHPNNAGARTDNGLAGLGGGYGRDTASANATPNTGGGGEVYGGGASGIVIVAY